MNILSYNAYQKMGLQDKDLLPTISHVYMFTRDVGQVKGMVKLPITLGEEPQITTQIHDFTVVDHSAGYNAIIGIPFIKEMRIVLSIYHLTVKFPTPHGTERIRGCQYDTRDCYNKAFKFAEKKSQHPPSHDMDILTIEDDGKARKTSDPKRQGCRMCNIMSIEELLEGYEEYKIIQMEPVPGALMMVPSQPRVSFQEGIVEEASDDEALPHNMTPSPTTVPRNVLTNGERQGEGTDKNEKTPEMRAA